MKTWNDMPSEIKEKVVLHCTPNTRLTLSFCSKLENRLVKNVRLNELRHVDIKMTAEVLSIECFDRFKRNEISFNTFDELQAAILLTMKEVNSIKAIKITLKERPKKSYLNMLTDEDRECCRLRKIEEIRIESDIYEEVVDILRQVDPNYLRKVEITTNISKEEFYQMSQVTNAEEVIIDIRRSFMKESHLVNLKARYVKMTHINFPVNKFIKMCILEANVKSAEFDITFTDQSLVAELLEKWRFYKKESEKVTVFETPYPHLKLEMTLDGLNLQGSIIFDSEKAASLALINDQYMLRVIEDLNFNYNSPFWRIDVTRKHQSSRSYQFKSLNEAQKKVDEILENVDFIKDFTISDFDGLLFHPRKKQLMVAWLDIFRSEYENRMESSGKLPNILDKIEPGYLGHFGFFRFLEKKDIFDMPQIINAESLKFDYVFPRDDQILKFKAERIEYWGSDEDFCLTSSGLNQCMKKWLLDLNVKCYCFALCSPNDWNEKELFEDLEYTQSQKNGRCSFVVKSDFPEYVLVLYYRRGDFVVERDLRKNHL